MSLAYHRRLREMQPLWLRIAYAVRDFWRGILDDARRYYVEDFTEWQDKRDGGRPLPSQNHTGQAVVSHTANPRADRAAHLVRGTVEPVVGEQ